MHALPCYEALSDARTSAHAAAGRGGQRHVQRGASRRASCGGCGASAREHDDLATTGGARAHAVRRRALRRRRRGGLRVPAGAVRCARPAAGSPPVPTALCSTTRAAAPLRGPNAPRRAHAHHARLLRPAAPLLRTGRALRCAAAVPPQGLEAASVRPHAAFLHHAAALVLYIAYGPGHAGGVLERAAGSRWGARSARA
jgi:hypothetical protein